MKVDQNFICFGCQEKGDVIPLWNRFRVPFLNGPWLYQYYNTEPKDKVFADLKKNIKISKQNIPAATQLFTPDWIVHYMVENSLGRLWVEGHEGQGQRRRASDDPAALWLHEGS